MVKNNIVNIYRFYNPTIDISYLYSIQNENPPSSFSYFMLTSHNGVTHSKKIHNALDFLQTNNLTLKENKMGEPEYEEFIALLRDEKDSSLKKQQTNFALLIKKE